MPIRFFSVWWRLVWVGALLSSHYALAQPPTWTLDQCVATALQNAPRLQASRYAMTAGEAAVKESRAGLYPTVGVSGAYAYTSETQSIDIAIGPISKSIQMGDGNVYDLSANVRIPLYAGGALVEKSKADAAAYRATGYDFVADSLRVLNDVRRAFFNVLGAQAREDAARQSVQRLERRLKEITDSQTAGMASEESRVMVEASLRQAEALVISAESDAQAARLQLGNLLGTPQEEIRPAGRLDSTLHEDDTAPPIESQADISAIEARIAQSNHLVGVSRSAWLPQLSGNAGYHYGKPGVNLIKNDWMNYYTLGVSASWTLWDWNARDARIKQAGASSNILSSRREDLVRSLQTRRSSTQKAMNLAREGVVKTAERAELQRKRMDMVEGRQKNGMASESEFLDAQDDLTSAEIDLASAQVRARLSEADYLNATGR